MDVVSIIGEAAVWGIGLAAVLMALDVLTGLSKAFSTKTFSSSVMRAGLWNKLGEGFALILAVVVQVGGEHFDLGIASGVAAVVALYVCLMELGSNLENIAALSPQLAGSKFMGLFESTKGDVQTGGTGKAGDSE
jgi:small basic protein